MTAPVRVNASIHVDPDAPIVAVYRDHGGCKYVRVEMGAADLYLYGAAAEKLLNVLGTALYGVDGDGAEVTAEPLSAPVVTTVVGSPVLPGGAA